MMTPQQAAAFDDPCFHAEETRKDKFGGRLPAPHDDVSYRLTANIGLE